MFQITAEKRDLFFKYLEKEGLVPNHNYRILEVAPNVFLSQSLLIAEKYGELYKQFLVSSRFKKDYGLFCPTGEVKGVKGTVECENADLIVRPDKKNIRTFCSVFSAEPFDTLLIQGQPEEAYNLFRTRQYLLFGDVCEKGDRETRDFYSDLFNTIRRYNIYGEDYELYHDSPRNGNKECYLIRHKSLRRTESVK